MASVDTVKLWTTMQSPGNHDPRAAPLRNEYAENGMGSSTVPKISGSPRAPLVLDRATADPEEQSKPQYTRYDSVERVNDYVSGEIVRKTSSVQ